MYAAFDDVVAFFDKGGNTWHAFHPKGLPPRSKLQPLSVMAMDDDRNKHAQRTWSSIVHHRGWLWWIQQHVRIGPVELGELRHTNGTLRNARTILREKPVSS